MGLLDKMKAGVANTGNYTSQKADEASINSKISDQKNTKKKLISESGEKMFAMYLEGKTELTDEIKEMFAKCVECDKEVERLEAEKAEMIAKYEGERQARRDAVKEQDEKEKAEREAKKAAAEAEKAAAEEKSE
ncbi:MAG: hypothetical protein J5707_03045 [Candidatus Methanomethylophilus sp.]|nr:hypothetical protein [Methanomethylophilus sp.]